MTGRVLLAFLGAMASLVVWAGPASAHSTSTYKGHGCIGTFHVHCYVYGYTDRYGRHVHVVQLSHPWSATPRYVRVVVG